VTVNQFRLKRGGGGLAQLGVVLLCGEVGKLPLAVCDLTDGDDRWLDAGVALAETHKSQVGSEVGQVWRSHGGLELVVQIWVVEGEDRRGVRLVPRDLQSLETEINTV
jgi:hypothetical protein